MNKILEMREKRSNLWDAAKAFRDSHVANDGTMNAEDAAQYDKMVDDVDRMKGEIERLEKMDAIDAEMNKPTSGYAVGKPKGYEQDKKTGKASDEYKASFWNAMRHRHVSPAVLDALQIGTDSEGGYLVPDEFEHTLVDALQEENVFRKLAHVIRTSSGDRKIPVVSSHGSASWYDEEAAIGESDDTFTQITLGAYKLGSLIKVSNELLNDSAFNLEQYIAKEFGRRIGAAEETAFFTGNGTGKPTGITAASGGATTGKTTASATAITADEIMDLFYALKAPYVKNAVWTMNNATVKAVRKLKDGDGRYLWEPSMVAGTPDTLLGRPVHVSSAMPTIAASAKVIAFGDFNYYWIADREQRVFKKLDQLYAANDQTGFMVTQRVDGKLIVAEAIQLLAMHA